MPNNKLMLLLGLAIVAGLAIGYFFGYDRGFEKSIIVQVDSFNSCARAGYPIMESYPEQCRTPDGRNFINNIKEPNASEPVFCIQDAKLCPDGSYVGRSGPKCEFTACPVK